MRKWHGLNVEAEGTGITQQLSEQVNLLGSLVGDAIREQLGEEIFELVESLRTRCKQANLPEEEQQRQGVAEEISALDQEKLLWLLRSYTTFFHLVNQAEQREISRINRQRERTATSDAPRSESISQAIQIFREHNYSLDDVLSILQNLTIQPTLTAHPTEARRRTILLKQKRIAQLLEQLQETHLTPTERNSTIDEIYFHVSILLHTNEIRSERPTVADEVKHGVYFLTRSIWDTVPRIIEDVEDALELYYQTRPDVPSFLRYRTWIGSDQDGNPNVTPDVTREALQTYCSVALNLYLENLAELHKALSISADLARIPDALLQSIRRDRKKLDLPSATAKRLKDEPFRLKLSYIQEKLRKLLRGMAGEDADEDGFRYTAQEFADDLNVIRDGLRKSNSETIANNRLLRHLIVRAQAFGFHLVAADIRQHSRVHEQAVAELLRFGGVTPDYTKLGETARLEVLHEELRNPRPLLPGNARLSKSSQRVAETFDLIAEMLESDTKAFGSYIISMTHQVSDMLEVLLLAKEAGLWVQEDGRFRSRIDVVPLFETIEDLERVDTILQQLFSDPLYKLHLQARNNFQEIMLGYSDSNKDGGYWMANWALHKAQHKIGEVCRRHDIDFCLFHGRGGTVGRGGGRANQAILAMQPESHTGRIRFTEQGEVISFRYALQSIAHRHLEQIVNAMLRVNVQKKQNGDKHEDFDLMERFAQQSMQSYESLIHDEGFWEWYVSVTPIRQISRLPIASRPVSRKSADKVDFEGLRAIPWVFAWTQTRYNVPGWFGIGRAFDDFLAEKEEHLEVLQRLYREWQFFRAVVDNVQLEIGRTRLPIARYYSELADTQKFDGIIKQDYDKATAAILKITGQSQILDNQAVIQKSIYLRNPYTDVLNLIQVELLKRWQNSGKAEREALRHKLFLSLNGIAAAMQSTG